MSLIILISFSLLYPHSMLKTLEKYQKSSYGSVEVNRPGKELEVA